MTGSEGAWVEGGPPGRTPGSAREGRAGPFFPSPGLSTRVSVRPAGRPYRGKPSDMWALGVVLFTMLYGQFPFYDSIPQELFRKIKAAEYTIPE